MNGITSRCISFAQGNKDPLQRVNYEFGLVLGVDEFVDEQCYFLEKEYQHNRALHGYGTVSGLLVGVDEPAGSDDIEIQVETGIGIDQYGRVFIVREKQCASLLSWLEEQEAFDGQTIYVVARYDECQTALVPIAGQPCSSSDQQTAPSRIQDAFAIELTLEEPKHPARDAVVNLAEFLSRLRVDPEAADMSGLGTPGRLRSIIGPTVIKKVPDDFLRHIDEIVQEITGETGAVILPIQPQIVETLLNDIFVYWLTEVRPRLDPDLIDPDAARVSGGKSFPPDVLLAEINLTFTDDGSLTGEGVAIDNSTRPYLLHTQLIQELFDVPELAEAGAETMPPKDVHTFVTIEDSSTRVLNLWFHINQNMTLIANENVTLTRVEPDGTLNPITIRGLSEDTGRRNDAGRYYRLLSTVNLEDGDLLTLRFDADRIEVSNGRSQRLSQFIANAAFTYKDYMPRSSHLMAYHVVERQEGINEEELRRLIVQLMPEQKPVVPFVTITPITVRQNSIEGYELWFHLDGIAEQNDGGISKLHQDNLAMYVESAPGVVDEVSIEAIQMVRPNVWMVIPQPGDNRQPSPLVRMVFSLEGIRDLNAFNPQTGSVDTFASLGEYMDKTGQQLAGRLMESKKFGAALVVHAREQSSARRLDQ